MKVNQRILILCEGLTEYYYTRALHSELPRAVQRSVSVEVDYSSKNDPKHLANEAIRRAKKARKERNAYDTIWLFFDHDNSPHLEAAFAIIESHGLKSAFCVICIEHWFILHYEDCGKAFADGDAALQYLKKLWPDYHKTKSKPYEKLKGNLENAKKRASILMMNQEKGLPLSKRNPYFSVCDLIDFFEALHEHGN